VAVADGQVLWQKAVGGEMPNDAELKVSQETGFAAPTPATDGQRVYAMFPRGDLVAFDLNGNELWYLNVGTPQNSYGHASSLATYEDLLIVQLDQGTARDDQSKLMALHGSTGEVAWQVKRAVPNSWSTPIVVQHAGQAQIITCSQPWVIAYAAKDGRELWRADCLAGDVGPSPVYKDGVVYVANDGAIAAAIDVGGEGDVTESHIRWTAEFGLPDICSPLVTDKQLLLVTSYGSLASYDREQGGEEPLWEADLDGVCMASPSRVGDQVYLISEIGKGSVLKPSDEGCEKLAENDLGERCFASPAFQPGRIYIRGEHHLFCIGQKTEN
jgi:outer membrane protein assembly factor BamB